MPLISKKTIQINLKGNLLHQEVCSNWWKKKEGFKILACEIFGPINFIEILSEAVLKPFLKNFLTTIRQTAPSGQTETHNGKAKADHDFKTVSQVSDDHFF